MVGNSELQFDKFKAHLSQQFQDFLDASKKTFIEFQSKACDELLSDISNAKTPTEYDSPKTRNSVESQSSMIVKSGIGSDFGQFQGIMFRSEGNSNIMHSYETDIERSIAYSSNKCKSFVFEEKELAFTEKNYGTKASKMMHNSSAKTIPTTKNTSFDKNKFNSKVDSINSNKKI